MKIPLYIILQASESMRGEPMRRALESIRSLWDSIGSNPVSLETYHLCVVGHGNGARMLMPVSSAEFMHLDEPDLCGKPALGDALKTISAIHAEFIASQSRLGTEWIRPPALLFLSNGERDESSADDLCGLLASLSAERFLVMTASGAYPLRAILDDRPAGSCGFCDHCFKRRFIAIDATSSGLSVGDHVMQAMAQLNDISVFLPCNQD